MGVPISENMVENSQKIDKEKEEKRKKQLIKNWKEFWIRKRNKRANFNKAGQQEMQLEMEHFPSGKKNI